jgi:glycerophosphoryl diester phosphodiesterase
MPSPLPRLLFVLGILPMIPVSGGAAGAAARSFASPPIVIAHRGASGYRPEHTLAAYELAIDMGADFIEPDLVLTKDGVFIARHENALAVVDPGSGEIAEATTNVHTLPEFATRRATKVVDGKTLTGWFAEDFTLAEIKRLRARERIPRERPQNTRHDDEYEIPTLQEIIDLAKRKGAALGRSIGIYPETKHPSYHASIGLAMEDRLVAVLQANGWNRADAPVFIQSFEVANLRYLSGITRVRLVQLLDSRGQPWDFSVRGDARGYADMATAEGLREIAAYAQGVGPNKNLVIARDARGRLAAPTPFVAAAHAAGLVVHPWTFRTENGSLPADYRRGGGPGTRGDGKAEIEAFLRTGIDGFFTDQPDIGVAARASFEAAR